MPRLDSNSLDWALAHALRHGDTDVFPIPFEFEAIQYDWQNVRTFLVSQDVLQWTTRPHRFLLAPKGRYSFRIVTQLDPLDLLIYASLIYQIGNDLENRRIPVSRNIVFSYRYSPDSSGNLFDSQVGYSEFQQQCSRLISGNGYSHVAVADIADFYHRIYLHRLENALRVSTAQGNYVSAIMRLLSGWNRTETYGIPVGNAPSRLLAEVTISDIDEALISQGIPFVRFNDDYRLFSHSHTESYQHLAFLASMLFQNHGLTLQPQKTFVLESDEFIRRFLPSPEDLEFDALQERFQTLIHSLGLNNPYEEIDYDDLTATQQEVVDSLNLSDMFDEQIDSGSPDYNVLRFILRRMGQLGDSCLVDRIFDNLNALYPIFPDIMRYFRRIRNLSSQTRQDIGNRLLNLLDNSIISELDYYRLWALDLYSRSTEWDNEDRFIRLLGSSRDLASRRKIILAMGRSAQRHWFQSRWRNLFDESHWPRRALIAATSCLASDARAHLYRSIEPSLDPLERAVMRWARANPFA